MDDGQSMSGDASRSTALVRAAGSLRAAAYVRMSTEHQRYSIDNQMDIIRSYAALRDIELTRTYSDPGKSGLDLKGRKGLQQLLADVCQQTEDFDLILVQDVSRWGRFQDSDEAAHYEHICRRAGYPVHYCAELWDNDGSPISSIMKSIKRVMASEYSRELSTKVFRTQCRYAEMGYRQAGTAGLGLRRMLMDRNGRPKGILEKGDSKHLRSDRVVLVAGPKHEVRLINDIFRLFVHENMTLSEVARTLNASGKRTINGCDWTCISVRNTLTNEKYIGNCVYNRTTSRLKTPRLDNPPHKWIRKEGAFEAIVDLDLFHAAQTRLDELSERRSSQYMLSQLQALFEEHGKLTTEIINKAKNTPRATAYQLRFGSLLRAYDLIGYAPERNEYRYLRRLQQMEDAYRTVAEALIDTIETVGGQTRYDSRAKLLHVNGEVSAKLAIAFNSVSAKGIERWEIGLSKRLCPDVVIVARMDSTYETVLDYFVFPAFHFPQVRIRFSNNTRLGVDAFRHPDLGFLADLAGRHPIQANRRSTKAAPVGEQVFGMFQSLAEDRDTQIPCGQTPSSKNTRQRRSIVARTTLLSFEKECLRLRSLVRAVKQSQGRLNALFTALAVLFSDEDFVTLLRAERLEALPWCLAAKILDSSADWVAKKQTLEHGDPQKRQECGPLSGVCPDAAEILQNKPYPPLTARMIRYMKPQRQVEVARLMDVAGNFTGAYARALMMATPPEQLVKPLKQRRVWGITERERSAMRLELENLRRDLRLLEDDYGAKMLHLVTVNAYLGRLLINAQVAGYLTRRHAELYRLLNGLQEEITGDHPG